MISGKVIKARKKTMVNVVNLKRITFARGFEEKRSATRMDVLLKVRYKPVRSKNYSEGVTKNVSAGGCLMLITEKLRVNSRLDIQLVLGQKRSQIMKISSKVLRLNREENNIYEYGICFDPINGKERRLFADFCFRKMYEKTSLEGRI